MKVNVRVAALSLFASMSFVGCGGDDGPTAPRFEPTPIPVPNIAGAWHGTLHPGNIPILCGSESAASATFTQAGAHVSGGVSPGGAFSADFTGSQFSGTLTNAAGSSAVKGSASSTNVAIHYAATNTGFCSDRWIELHR
jgi:hypothetical protein